jgi:hypothetical protein
VHINSPVPMFARRVRILLVATVVAAVFGLVPAAQASAYGGSENFCGSTLLGKAQICTSAVGKSTEYIFNIAGENITNGNAVCVGPVTWNGKEYSAPYGYSCGGAVYDWEFTPISSVAAAVENPNGVSEKIGGLFDWKEYPPVATTESASGIQPSQATLNGTLNPERSQAHYYFEYGKTTSYGSSTGEQSAGSGTSNEKESAIISGLEEGTTYHFRLVVKNAVGTTYGGDQAFTTYGIPTVTTGSASSIAQTHTVLGGTVNPNGVETHYHFEYGPTTAYGFSTMEGNAGSGRSTESEQLTVSKLEPSTVYHYRLVASNTWGTGYGKDEVLTTHQEDDTSPGWALRDPISGRQLVFYQGTTNHQIDVWNFESGSGWTSGEHGGHAAASGTTPSVIYVPGTGRIVVFYQGSNNQIDAWNYEGGSWTWGEHSGHAAAAGTSPSAVYNPSTGRIVVFYQGSNNQIDAWNFEGKEWVWGEHGGHAAATSTSPSVAYNPGTGRFIVFYQGSNNQIDAWNFEGKEWVWGEHGGHAAAASTSPSVTYSPETGRILAFYHGSNNQIDAWNYENGSWTWGEHGSHAVAAGASPAVIHDPESGAIWAYYIGSNNAINAWVFESEWTWGEP